MTRGRHGNHAYTCTDTPAVEAHQDHDQPTGREILHAVLARTDTEPSANRVIAVEQDRAGSIAQLAAEYDTIAALAQRDRWAALLRNSGLTPEQVDRAIASKAFGPLCAALRRADAHHRDSERVMPRVVAVRTIGEADDVAAVLHHRLVVATTRRSGSAIPRPAPRLIAGLIPRATGLMPDGLRRALEERERLIEQRAVDLAREAVVSCAAWVEQIRRPPADTASRRAWFASLTTIAAYRDRNAITGDTPLGEPTHPSRHPGFNEAVAALQHANQLALQEHMRHAPTAYVRGPTLDFPGRSL